MAEFTVYPAIDLRQGQVVRLQEGDPARQTIYQTDPAAAARRWLEAGSPWLHVVNLDGAFGMADQANRLAVVSILATAAEYGAQVQLGGGLRTLEALETALDLGVDRAVVGTLAIEQPDALAKVLHSAAAQRVAVSLDARDGLVRTHGWAEATQERAVEVAQRLAALGLNWLVHTDISRDGLGNGLNVQASQEIAQASGLNVIGSGGVDSMDDIRQAQAAGLCGVIVGRALYENKLPLEQLWPKGG